MPRARSRRVSFVAIAAAATIAACTAKSGTDSDSGRAAVNVSAAPGTASADSAKLSGTKPNGSVRVSDTSASASTTGDPDHDFLRMMSDHHKGLILIVHETIDSKAQLDVKPLARRIDNEQDKELDAMMSMLEKNYNDPYAPKASAEHRSMADELTGKSGADFDRTFLTNVSRHHEEGITMIDHYLASAKQPAVKQMAEKMKALQTKEIAEIRSRLSRMKA